MNGMFARETAGAVRRGVTVAMLALGLVGCSAVVGPEAIATYDLQAPQVTAAPHGRALQVLVADPVVDRALDTDRIVVRQNPTSIAYFAGAQWSDRLPRLVQSRLVQTLEASGRFRAAGRPGQGLAVDRQIVLEIRAFDYLPADGQVSIVLAVKSMDDRSGRVVAMRVFEASEAVTGDSAPAVVAGFDAALGRVLGEIAQWAGH